MAGSTQISTPNANSVKDSQNISRAESSWLASPSEEFNEARVAWKRAIKKSVILGISALEKMAERSKIQTPILMKDIRAKLREEDKISTEADSEEEECVPRKRMLRLLLCCGGSATYKQAALEAPSDVETNGEEKEKKALFPVQRVEPFDPTVSAVIAERLRQQILEVRKQILSRRAETKTAARRQENSVHFPKTLEKLKILFLIAKVKLVLSEVNLTNGTGEYTFVDDLQQFTFGKSVRRFVTTLNVQRPSTGFTWRAKFKKGSGRNGMDVYASAVLKAVAWEFFGPEDVYKSEGIDSRFLPAGEEVREHALATSMNELTFQFLKR